jgi:hypothetical protein
MTIAYWALIRAVEQIQRDSGKVDVRGATK